MSNLPVHIRWMIRRDMPYLLEIERLSFMRPWSEEDFLRFLRKRGCIGMVAEGDDPNLVLVGFMFYEKHKTHLELHNFAVHPDHRRLGIGRQMADKIESKVGTIRRTRVLLKITENNLEGQLFFQAMGYRAISVLPDYYDDGADAYLMEYRYRNPQWASQNRIRSVLKK